LKTEKATGVRGEQRQRNTIFLAWLYGAAANVQLEKELDEEAERKEGWGRGRCYEPLTEHVESKKGTPFVALNHSVNKNKKLHSACQQHLLSQNIWGKNVLLRIHQMKYEPEGKLHATRPRQWSKDGSTSACNVKSWDWWGWAHTSGFGSWLPHVSFESLFQRNLRAE
jgi:hypothetical protein